MASAIAAILIVPWAALQRSHAQSDLANSILALHNSERAAVGVPALVWSDKLAADAKPWAEHLATSGEFVHDTNRGNVGENIAGFFSGVSAPGEGQSKWVDEKKDWNGGRVPPGKCAVITRRWSGETRKRSVARPPKVVVMHSVFWCAATARRATTRGRSRIRRAASSIYFVYNNAEIDRSGHHDGNISCNHVRLRPPGVYKFAHHFLEAQ